MKIVVCMKQVPDTNEVRINQETGTLIRDGVPSIMNPDDKNALEAALAYQDAYPDTEVIALSMGPVQAKEILKEALAMGANHAILVSDRKFGGSDTWATSTILAAALEKIGDYDLILCGRQAIDGDTAQVGPEIAEFLDLPQITYAKEIRPIDDKTLEVRRFTEYGDFVYQTKLPALLTAIKELNTPRYPNIRGIYENFTEGENVNIETWVFDDLPVDPTQIGLKGSPTNVHRSFVPVKDSHSEILDGATVKDKTDALVRRLAAVNLV